MTKLGPLPTGFYGGPTPEVARALLGAVVASRSGGHRTAGRIVECEAYLGPGDPGSHARNGPTPRSAIMFGPVGVAYVYVCYGIHDMLNVVAHGPDTAGAVLIRALEPLEGLDVMAKRRGTDDAWRLCRGPGALTQALGITRREHNGKVLERDPLWIEEGPPRRRARVATTTRIGLSKDNGALLRFVEHDSPFATR